MKVLWFYGSVMASGFIYGSDMASGCKTLLQVTVTQNDLVRTNVEVQNELDVIARWLNMSFQFQVRTLVQYSWYLYCNV